MILFENKEILMKIELKAASKMKSHFSLIGINFGELFSYMQWLWYQKFTKCWKLKLKGRLWTLMENLAKLRQKMVLKFHFGFRSIEFWFNRFRVNINNYVLPKNISRPSFCELSKLKELLIFLQKFSQN